jgi:hypothetical protein
MKRPLFLITIGLAVTTIGFAAVDKTTKAQVSSEVEVRPETMRPEAERLLGQDSKWHATFVTHDPSYASRLLADDFLAHHQDGSIGNKQTVLRNIKNFPVTKMQRSNIGVRFYAGGKVALVSVLVTATYRDKDEFSWRVVSSPAHEVGTVPYGTRLYHELLDATMSGERLTAKMIGTGGDWMLSGPDGYVQIDVRAQVQTDDSALIYVQYRGPVEVTEKFKHAADTFGETNFEDQLIRTYWQLETGDPRYAWVNRTIFVGEGRLLSGGPGLLGMEHHVYRLA